MGDGMTKVGAGSRGDVQRQMRAAAVDLAVQPRQKMEAWQIPCAGLVSLLALLIVGMGTLELRGGDLIWSHWEAWMMAAYSKFASHTIHDDGVVRPRHRP